MNDTAIKDLHYAGVTLENSLKITRAFNLKEIFQISRVLQILNCLSFHMITHLLYDWENCDRVLICNAVQIKNNDKLACS